MINNSIPSTEKIVILAPTGQDAHLVARALEGEAVATAIVPEIKTACARIEAGSASALLIAEEALTTDGVALLNVALERQKPWSDLPIVLMTSQGDASLLTLKIMKAFSPAGNLTLLERPFRRITLQSVVQVALRARKKQHEVRLLLEQHAAATRVRDEFISIASHELKTPLTSLKLQTQMSQRMMSKGDPLALEPVRMRGLIDSTSKQLDRLGRLVEDMLDISRINTGKLKLQLETFDLADLAREAVERFMPQLQAEGCQVQVISPVPVTGTWDRYRIEQVLNNLLSNAIRYSPGKPITIDVACLGSEARLMVRDEGRGIALEDQERIFHRFERAVEASNISGLGLGLYICREILEAHQGRIVVESSVGTGSTFIVSLPLAKPEARARVG